MLPRQKAAGRYSCQHRLSLCTAWESLSHVTGLSLPAYEQSRQRLGARALCNDFDIFEYFIGMSVCIVDFFILSSTFPKPIFFTFSLFLFVCLLKLQLFFFLFGSQEFFQQGLIEVQYRPSGTCSTPIGKCPSLAALHNCLGDFAPFQKALLCLGGRGRDQKDLTLIYHLRLEKYVSW